MQTLKEFDTEDVLSRIVNLHERYERKIMYKGNYLNKESLLYEYNEIAKEIRRFIMGDKNAKR